MTGSSPLRKFVLLVVLAWLIGAPGPYSDAVSELPELAKVSAIVPDTQCRDACQWRRHITEHDAVESISDDARPRPIPTADGALVTPVHRISTFPRLDPHVASFFLPQVIPIARPLRL